MKRTVKVKYISKDMPRLKTSIKGDCIDLYVEDINVKTVSEDSEDVDSLLVSFGIAMRLPKGYYARLYARSSNYNNYSMILSNSVGIIDNSYCGGRDIWKAKFIKLDEGDTRIPEIGSRVCQFEIVPSMHMKWYQKIAHLFTSGFKFVEVDKLPTKDRGGFGSTGI